MLKQVDTLVGPQDFTGHLHRCWGRVLWRLLRFAFEHTGTYLQVPINAWLVDAHVSWYSRHGICQVQHPGVVHAPHRTLFLIQTPLYALRFEEALQSLYVQCAQDSNRSLAPSVTGLCICMYDKVHYDLMVYTSHVDNEWIVADSTRRDVYKYVFTDA